MSASRLLLIGLLVLFTGGAWYFGRPKSVALPAAAIAPRPAADAKAEPAAGRVEEDKTEQAQALWQRFATKNLGRAMSRAALEQFVEARGHTAGSLLAAWSESRERGWLEEAARRYPEDPAVQIAVLTNNLFPEQRADWIRRFKESSPDNPLADYLAANDQFRGGARGAAMAELREALTRTSYNDYLLSSLEEREALEQSAFSDPAEAELRAISGLPVGQVPPVAEAAKSLLAVQREAAANGDWPTAEEAAALGVDMAHALTSRSGPAVLINDLLAISVESAAVQALTDDPNAAAALGFDPATRLAELDREKAELKTLTELLNPGDAGAYARYAVEFGQRMKSQGELSALRWLAAQR